MYRLLLLLYHLTVDDRCHWHMLGVFDLVGEKALLNRWVSKLPSKCGMLGGCLIRMP